MSKKFALFVFLRCQYCVNRLFSFIPAEALLYGFAHYIPITVFGCFIKIKNIYYTGFQNRIIIPVYSGYTDELWRNEINILCQYSRI